MFELLSNRSLRRLAGHGDKLSLKAFAKGLHDIEMGSAEEATRIFRTFETDYTGYIDMNDFLFDIRFLSQVNEVFSNSSSINYFVISILLLVDARRMH